MSNDNNPLYKYTSAALMDMDVVYEELTWEVLQARRRDIPLSTLAHLLRQPHPNIADVPLADRVAILQNPHADSVTRNRIAYYAVDVIVHCPANTPGASWDERLKLLEDHSDDARVLLASHCEAVDAAPDKRLDLMTTMDDVRVLIKNRPSLQPRLRDHPRTRVIMDYADLTRTCIVPDQFGEPQDPSRSSGTR